MREKLFPCVRRLSQKLPILYLLSLGIDGGKHNWIQLFFRGSEEQKEICSSWGDKLQLWTPMSDLRILPCLWHHQDFTSSSRSARDHRSCLLASQLIGAPKLFLREKDRRLSSVSHKISHFLPWTLHLSWTLPPVPQCALSTHESSPHCDLLQL